MFLSRKDREKFDRDKYLKGALFLYPVPCRNLLLVIASDRRERACTPKCRYLARRRGNLMFSCGIVRLLRSL